MTVAKPALHVPANPVRFVTAASLFDGHDAAINIMRRLLQSQGAEVVHLGHDRSVADIVTAAIQEDVQGVAISSYQGGHVEYFTYLVQELAARGAGHVKVYGGGGGVIVPSEIEQLRAAGAHIFSPQDGQRLGLPGMINELIAQTDVDIASGGDLDALLAGEERALARAITLIESGRDAAFGYRLNVAQERLRPQIRQLNGERTLVALGSIVHKSGKPFQTLYLSNVEQWFKYSPQFQRNLSALPAAPRAQVLRTLARWELHPPPGDRWHFSVQPLGDFLARMRSGELRLVQGLIPEMQRSERARGLSVLGESPLAALPGPALR